MKRWERVTFNVMAAAIVITGFGCFWMKYLVRNDDPFALVNHPWEPATLAAHVLASPLFILIFGIVLNSHIMRKLRAPGMPNRRSGLLSFGTFGLMIASGYFLQVTTDERWLPGLVAVHVGSGALFAVAYGVHLFVSARQAPRRAAAPRVRTVA